MVIAVASAVFIFCVFLLFVQIVPPYTADLIVFLGKPVRSRGSGICLVFRPLEWVSEAHSLKERTINDKMNAETKSKEVASLDFSIEYHAAERQLIQFLSFTQEQLENAIKQRIKSLLSIEVGEKEDWDDVQSHLEDIAKAVEAKFALLYASQYAVELRFMIDDPELDPKIVESANKLEIQKKENERRKIEIVEMQALARGIVKDAEKRGEKLTIQDAIDLLQVQFKIVQKEHKEERKVLELGAQTLWAIREAAKELAGLILEKGGKDGS